MAKHELQIDKLFTALDDVKKYYNVTTFDPLEIRKMDEVRRRCELNFYEFVKEAWSSLEGPSIPFYDNWHIKALCDHLQATYDMTIMNLIINLPPRCSKSSIVSAMLVPWIWTRAPHLTFMYVCHSYDLAERDSRRTRDLITSPWYRNLWGNKVVLKKDANTLKRFYNTAGGFRMITTASSGVTGEGAYYRIFDDYNDKESIFSPLARARANLQFDGGFSTRVAHPSFTRTLICSQRLHELDLVGYVLSKDNRDIWVHLCLPMRHDMKRICKTVPLKKGDLVWTDPRKEAGELLWPNYWIEEKVTEQEGHLKSAYNISSQMQQQPRSDEGNVIKRDWFQVYKEWELPKCEYVIQSWDTAISDGEHSAYSACTVWGIFDDPVTEVPQIILLNAWRGRVKYYELRRIAKILAFNYLATDFDKDAPQQDKQPDMVLIEAKATGSPLIDDLSRAGIIAVAFDPVKEGSFVKRQGEKYNSKGMRAEMASALIEAKRVWLPGRPPFFSDLQKFADEFLEAACLFPAGDGADYVDSMSQCFIRIMKSQLTYMPEDEKPIPKMQLWKEREPIY